MLVALFIGSATLTHANEILFTYLNGDNFVITVERDDDNKKLIRFEGAVTYMLGQQLVSLIELHSDLDYIEMHSVGGILAEINGPAVKIAERGIPVVIRPGDTCVSACAFLALYSPDITIEGQLAFHLPYHTGFDRIDTLYDIQQSMVARTVVISREFFKTGWRLILYHLIAEKSDMRNYVVFTNEVDLNLFRFEDPNDFVKPTGAPSEFHIRNDSELNQYANQQLTQTAE